MVASLRSTVLGGAGRRPKPPVPGRTLGRPGIGFLAINWKAAGAARDKGGPVGDSIDVRRDVMTVEPRAGKPATDFKLAVDVIRQFNAANPTRAVALPEPGQALRLEHLPSDLAAALAEALPGRQAMILTDE